MSPTANEHVRAYREHGAVLGRRALLIAGGLSLLLSLVFTAVHDRQFDADVYAHLLHLRIAHGLGLGVIVAAALWTAWGRAHVWALAFLGTMLGTAMVLAMMPWSGGHASPYFGGLGLVMLGSALFYPSPARWTIASVIAIPLAYVGFVAWVPGSADVVVRNLVGLVATALIALAAALPRERLRRREFVARREAELARSTANQALLTARREGAVTAGLSCAGREMLELSQPALVVDRLCTLSTTLLAADAAVLLIPAAPAGGWRVTATTRQPEGAPAVGAELDRAVIDPLLPALQRGAVIACTAASHAGLLAKLAAASALAFALRDGGRVVAVQLVAFAELTIPPAWPVRRLARGLGNLGSLALARAHVLRDLTASRQAAEAMLASLSHELRTPLNVILGLSEMATETDDLAEARELIGGVRRAGERLASLVSDLLAARDVSGGPLRVVPVPLLVRELQRATAGLRPAPGVRLRWPSRVPALAVRCHAGELTGALSYLLVNAVQFTRHGLVALEVERRGRTVRFVVRDTGVGIAPEDRERVFELFRHGESREEQLGLGVGLYVARRTIEAIGGVLEVESTPGVGSAFTAVLPLATSREAGPAADDRAA
ncbi:MAG: HAMP domain-containing histidine kinase [bacterium]|nr:HAMP domain-containing histidine kinase [bacterium]